MNMVTVGGTAGKRALSEYLASALPDAWLLALEGESGGRDAEEPGLTGPEFAGALETSGLFEPDAVLVLEANVVFSGLRPSLAVFLTEEPLGELPPGPAAAAAGSDVVLVELGPAFAGEQAQGLERAVKDATGAGKILMYGDEAGRERAFAKVADVARSRLGGGKMPEDIPAEVVEALEREAEGGRMSCARAQELAGELGVPLSVVGRALDLLGIKITECQLGCF